MSNFKNIVIFHPGAIGDVVLATPVAVTLKSNYPHANITHWTHESLFDLLKLCPAVDMVFPFDKNLNWLQQRRTLHSFKPDLLIDLAGSSRSHWLGVFDGKPVLRYKKQPSKTVPIQHAVNNFLDTLSPLLLKQLPNLFPTLIPSEKLLSEVNKKLPANSKPLIGLVPGVGKLRPHRAWREDGWIQLAKQIIQNGKYLPVLIGGRDDATLCKKITQKIGTNCINMANILSLSETAALTKLCKAVISGDTGPAHIAVAVGTPVVGLYGPTFAERSGPYGYNKLVINKCHHCQCHNSKKCIVPDCIGSGECMKAIQMDEVASKLALALNSSVI